MRLTQSTRQYLVSEAAIFRHFKKLISVKEFFSFLFCLIIALGGKCWAPTVAVSLA